jgi:hypothetical protein
VDENPWPLLPDSKPFVLPEDKPAVDGFNGKLKIGSKRRLPLDLLPEPFVGAPDAPVVLLSNNPGIGKAAEQRRQRAFMERMRKNLLHERSESEYPFLYLDPKLPGVGDWWKKKLKCLLEDCGGEEAVAGAILNVPFFPYASQRFGHRELRLPSQQYTFHLVREAMKRQAVIVFMRRMDVWEQAIPGLTKHGFQVKNVQNPAISPNNCGDANYQKVVEAVAKRKGR